ncbi:MAG: fasciclin domain-containing protein [Anaerolineae bacterium]|nr:fasciclin domain-containing protein [Anaerolineae bacterium]
MKHSKRTLTILTLLLALLLAACGGADPTPEPAAATPTAETMDEPMDNEAMDEEMDNEAMEEEMDNEAMDEESMDNEAVDEAMTDEEMMTVGDIAMADNTFSMLVDAVLATGLDTVVQGDDPITVFAPTNEAFAALPEGLLASLTEDQLRAVLTYHVVPGRVTSEQVAGMDMGTSALGEDFDVTVNGNTIMINDATIVSADIEGSNGIIHVIDAVLIPPSLMSGMEEMDDMGDMGDMEMMDFSALYATSNPAELADDAIVSIAPDFSETMNSITAFAEGVTSVESIALTSDGTYFLTVDLGEEAGAIVSLADLNNMSPDALALSADLTAPKGLYIAEEAGLVLVADFGAGAIVGYDMALTPLFTITDFGDAAGSVWDVYHDAASDTLFATGTDGTLIVYENFSEMMGAEGPSKTIVPSDADGNKISVNLHGVWYNAATDELILTDVGDAASAEDGALYVIPSVMTAVGNTPVSVMVAGPESMLGNPVDVVFDGRSAYVAEKSNDAILRFDDILSADMMGMMGDAAPSAMFELIKAESVWLSYADMMQ